MTKDMAGEALQRRIGSYDRGDDRYNLLSALRSQSGEVIRMPQYTIWPVLLTAEQIYR